MVPGSKSERWTTKRRVEGVTMTQQSKESKGAVRGQKTGEGAAKAKQSKKERSEGKRYGEAAGGEVEALKGEAEAEGERHCGQGIAGHHQLRQTRQVTQFVRQGSQSVRLGVSGEGRQKERSWSFKGSTRHQTRANICIFVADNESQ